MKKTTLILLGLLIIASCSTLKYRGSKIPYASRNISATTNLSSDSLCTIMVKKLRSFGWLLDKYDIRSHIITTAPRTIYLVDYYIIVNVDGNTITAGAYYQSGVKWMKAANTWGSSMRAFNQATHVMLATGLPLSFSR